MAEVEEGKIVKAGQFVTGCLYRTEKPFSSREFNLDAHSRWLLYLGNSSSFDCKVLTYLFTSTTQLQYFDKGGEKEKAPHRTYEKGKFGFTEKCVICFDDIIDYLTEKDIEQYEPVYKGTFDSCELRAVYDCILKSDKIKIIDKIDIQNNLSKLGITKLPKPKRRKRYKK